MPDRALTKLEERCAWYHATGRVRIRLHGRRWMSVECLPDCSRFVEVRSFWRWLSRRPPERIAVPRDHEVWNGARWLR